MAFALRTNWWVFYASFSLLLVVAPVQAQQTEEQLKELREQNRRLQAQVLEQQKKLDELDGKMEQLLRANSHHEEDLQKLQQQMGETPGQRSPGPRRDHEIRLSGEMGMAFFRTGAEGQFPNSEFRVDDPKIFVEAPVWKNVFFYSELDLLPRETADESFQLGEIYIDFENVPTPWHQPGLLNLRLGRFFVPFGEEYQVRGVIANPLISHSLSDVWGQDEGVQAYGRLGRFHYNLAVQNGGLGGLHDFNSDKTYMARLGYHPADWLQLSASALRTGRLDARRDFLSALWFGNGFFRALGAPATTRTFAANLFEADAAVHWKEGHLRAAAGRVSFIDDDTARDNSRRLTYYYIEGQQQLPGNFYGAMRWSEITASRGYPLVGWGNFGSYFFSGTLTDSLKRLSLGLGYRFGPPLVWKFEYARERGHETTGDRRDKEDLLSTEVGVKF